MFRKKKTLSFQLTWSICNYSHADCAVSYHKIACLQCSSSKRTVYYQLFKSYCRSGSTTRKVIDFANRRETKLVFSQLQVQKGGSWLFNTVHVINKWNARTIFQTNVELHLIRTHIRRSYENFLVQISQIDINAYCSLHTIFV